MRQALHQLHVETHGKGLVEITPQVAAFVQGERIATGLLTLFAGIPRPRCSFRKTLTLTFRPILRLFLSASRRRTLRSTFMESKGRTICRRISAPR
jgi:hypothetical protein